MLKVRDLNVYYGGIHAIRGVNVNVKKGEIATIIGSNGAGKSSLLNSISGIVKYSGSIEFNGHPLSTQAHNVVKSGICQVPEGRIIFANLTVHENLKMGAYLRKDTKGVMQILKEYMSYFQGLGREKSRLQELFPEESSRCWPWAVVSCRHRS